MGSRIRAFNWYQNQWPWVTLNGVMTADARRVCGSWSFYSSCWRHILWPHCIFRTCPNFRCLSRISGDWLITCVLPMLCRAGIVFTGTCWCVSQSVSPCVCLLARGVVVGEQRPRKYIWGERRSTKWGREGKGRWGRRCPKQKFTTTPLLLAQKLNKNDWP